MLLAASGMRALWFDRWMDPVVKSVLLLGNWTIDSAWSSLHCLGRCRALIGCEGMFGRHVRQTRSLAIQAMGILILKPVLRGLLIRKQVHQRKVVSSVGNIGGGQD